MHRSNQSNDATELANRKNTGWESIQLTGACKNQPSMQGFFICFFIQKLRKENTLTLFRYT